MKFELTDYQQVAVEQLVDHIRSARSTAETTKHAFVLSAPTGSGKTAIITAALERVLSGDEHGSGDPHATFLWVTDAPDLNEQSKKKIVASSEVFTPARLVTVDNDFDQPTLDSGKLYFLNTQKLGSATTYTRASDGRTHTVWNTIWATVTERPESFYLILDEAQKGLGPVTAKEAGEKKTIVRRLILGEGGNAPPSLLVGISATPQRFNDLLAAATDRVRWPTHVSPEDVRGSGLIKDEIVLWHTRTNGQTNWALLRASARKLDESQSHWKKFCSRDNRDLVRPILVVQVTDAPKGQISRTDLAQCLSELEASLGPLRGNEIGHCFQEPGPVALKSGRLIRKIQPSDIQDDDEIRVVFFKMALNTGWDCPRAEVMMSFRRAADKTHIAQLVGRMVRTPLAERIVSEPFLNSVALYLPNWDNAAVEGVIAELTTSDDALPVSVERGSELASYKRAPRSKALFEACGLLPTYPSRRANQASDVKRLLQFARYLANDGIDPNALADAKNLLLDVLERNRRRLKGKMTKLVETVQTADLFETRLALGLPVEKSEHEESASKTTSIALVEQNVRETFDDAGRRIGGGVHLEYVKKRTSRKGITTAHVARAEFCVLANDSASVNGLEAAAGAKVKDWWTKCHAARLALSPERQAQYAKVNRMGGMPEAEDLKLPNEIITKVGPKSFSKHLYSDSKGLFKPSPKLNRWEELTLERELRLKGLRGWLRNAVRKDWSLGVTYDERGLGGVMYPDFLVVRATGGGGVVVDVLEPHAPSQGDTTPKLLGLCRFAEYHGDRFGRIALVIVEGPKGREKLLYINVNDADVRAKARLLTENPQVVALAREIGSDTGL